MILYSRLCESCEWSGWLLARTKSAGLTPPWGPTPASPCACCHTARTRALCVGEASGMSWSSCHVFSASASTIVDCALAPAVLWTVSAEPPVSWAGNGGSFTGVMAQMTTTRLRWSPLRNVCHHDYLQLGLQAHSTRVKDYSVTATIFQHVERETRRIVIRFFITDRMKTQRIRGNVARPSRLCSLRVLGHGLVYLHAGGDRICYVVCYLAM